MARACLASWEARRDADRRGANVPVAATLPNDMETFNRLVARLTGDGAQCHASMGRPGKVAAKQFAAAVTAKLQGEASFSIDLVTAIRTVAHKQRAKATHTVCRKLFDAILRDAQVSTAATCLQALDALTSKRAPTPDVKPNVDALVALVATRATQLWEDVEPLDMDARGAGGVGDAEAEAADGYFSDSDDAEGEAEAKQHQPHNAAPGAGAGAGAQDGGNVVGAAAPVMCPSRVFTSPQFWVAVIGYVKQGRVSPALADCDAVQGALDAAARFRSCIDTLNVTLGDINRLQERWDATCAVYNAADPRGQPLRPHVFEPVARWRQRWHKVNCFVEDWCALARASDLEAQVGVQCRVVALSCAVDARADARHCSRVLNVAAGRRNHRYGPRCNAPACQGRSGGSVLGGGAWSRPGSGRGSGHALALGGCAQHVYAHGGGAH